MIFDCPKSHRLRWKFMKRVLRLELCRKVLTFRRIRRVHQLKVKFNGKVGN